MTFTYILSAFAAGAVIVYIVMSTALARARRAKDAQDVRLSQADDERARLTAQTDALTQRNDELLKENSALLADNSAKSREIALTNKQHEEELSRRDELFRAQLAAAMEKIANVGRSVMADSSRQLREDNAESIGTITSPLKDAITEMKKALGDSTRDNAQTTAAITEQIRMMMQSSKEIGEKAESLANVLRRDNKAAGDMGELILGDLLDSQGLKEGVHYTVQRQLTDSAGRPVRHDDTDKALRPDVIIHYPQGQDAVIDSKVSIAAYQKYINATTDDERKRYIDEHIRSIRRHVDELARKDYSAYIRKPRTAVDFVIMFVPFESALQLALAADPALWSDAFKKKVFITGEQNLAGILHIIHIAWVQNEQTENQKKIFKIAEQLVDRLGEFIKRYDRLGSAIDDCSRAYEDTKKKLYAGRQSVVGKGNELVALGVKENPEKRIPEAEPALSASSGNDAAAHGTDDDATLITGDDTPRHDA